jgi:hypothetical protein
MEDRNGQMGKRRWQLERPVGTIGPEKSNYCRTGESITMSPFQGHRQRETKSRSYYIKKGRIYREC